MFFTLLLALGIIASLLYLLKRRDQKIKADEKQFKKKESQGKLYKGLIENCPDKWLIWFPEQNSFILDTRLAIDLGLPDRQEIPFAQFSHCFSSLNSEELQNKLNNLHWQGERFDTLLVEKKNQKPLQLIAQSKQKTSQTSYILWLQPITTKLTEAPVSAPTQSDDLISALDSLPLPLWMRDENDRITFCNKTYAQRLQTTPEFLKNESHQTFKVLCGASGDQALDMKEVAVPGLHEFIGVAIQKQMNSSNEGATALKDEIVAQQEILNTINTGIVVYCANKHISYFNAAYVRMFDMDETWLESKPSMTEVLDNLHKRRLLTEHADFAAFKQKSLELFNTLTSPTQELIHLPDERTISVVTAPHPSGGLICVFEDVTDSLIIQRQANTQLAVQKETLDHLYEGIVVFASDNRLKLANPAFLKLWRLTPESLKAGQHISSIIESIKEYFDYGDNWDDYKQKVISTFTDRVPKNGRLTRRDESVLEYTYVPLPDGAHLVSYTDVSDSYRAERTLKERNQALEEADRLKSEFLHSFSFDLKAPINTIIGFSEILSDQYFGQLNKQQTTYCKGILQASTQLLRLVNDIIDLATIEAGQLDLNLQPIEPRALLTSIGSMVRQKIKDRQLTLSVTCSNDMGDFVGDERRLKQVLVNLIQNAIKFTPAGGTITLSAAKIGQNIHLSVTDTGLALAKRSQRQIFNDYSQNKEEETNLREDDAGLGLSLVKSLIKLHGGQVITTSNNKSGIKVNCIIPLNLPQAAQPKLPNMAIL